MSFLSRLFKKRDGVIENTDQPSKSIDGKVLKNMFASKGRNEFADSLLIPLVEAEVKKRPHINALTDEQIISSLKDVLEEISDNMEPALA